jgi:UDP-glucose/GDP-mannose dehydrogenase family protein
VRGECWDPNYLKSIFLDAGIHIRRFSMPRLIKRTLFSWRGTMDTEHRNRQPSGLGQGGAWPHPILGRHASQPNSSPSSSTEPANRPSETKWINDNRKSPREFDRHTRFIELAGEINAAMPLHVVERVGEALNASRKPINGSRVLVLGVAYKPNVDDQRESPSYRIMELLKQRGAEVRYCDPHVPVILPAREHPHWAGTKSVSWDRATIAGFDAVVNCDRPRLRELSTTR